MTMDIQKKNEFIKNGWTIKKIFNKDDYKNFILCFNDILKMQLRKMNITSFKDISKNVNLIKKSNFQALIECLSMVKNTSSGHILASNKVINEFSNMLLSLGQKNSNRLIISGPSFFINCPNDDRMKYTWHAEQNWYPKRRKFLNIWCPLYDRDNNTMSLKTGSHNKDWFYFSEYSGYNEDFDNKANVQYEIPETFIKKFKIDIPSVKSGEGIFFDSRIVHRSLNNDSKNIWFAIVFRVFDYSNDLTLSANWADIPYNRLSLGFPEINVKE